MDDKSKTFRQRILDGELLTGTFVNMGSPVAAEIAAHSGFDWVLLDLEHGAGGEETLLHQLQAVSGTDALPMVRITANETPRFKRALDLGARGIMVPWVSNAAEAEQAVASMRYAPWGIRGVAKSPRATGYGTNFDYYYPNAANELLTIIQIEVKDAVDSVQEIAAVDGVDVLFVGPMDLSVGLGVMGQFDHPLCVKAWEDVAKAARDAGKSAGILLASPDQIPTAIDMGYNMIAIGSDGSVLGSGMHSLANAFDPYRKK